MMTLLPKVTANQDLATSPQEVRTMLQAGDDQDSRCHPQRIINPPPAPLERVTFFFPSRRQLRRIIATPAH